MVFLSIYDIIKYIKSLERVGCNPFKFISEKNLIEEYKNTPFTLVENLNYNTKRVNWGNVEDYSPDISLKIDKKILDEKINLYYKNIVYNNVLKNPVVIGYRGEIIDGYHRLKKVQIDKLNFKAWMPVYS